MHRWLASLSWCLLLGAVVHADEINPEPLDRFPKSTLTIGTPDARLHRFSVWIAANDARRQQGLMYVKSMPADAGMLFVYARPQPLSMWMKNTFISLDMLFIRANGKVASVVKNTTPHSLKTISSAEDALAVLELNAGTADKLGIRPGAVVKHAVFGNGP